MSMESKLLRVAVDVLFIRCVWEEIPGKGGEVNFITS